MHYVEALPFCVMRHCNKPPPPPSQTWFQAYVGQGVSENSKQNLAVKKLFAYPLRLLRSSVKLLVFAPRILHVYR